MPAQTAKGGLMAKHGDKLRKAHEQHKADETTFGGGGSLPPGIEGGIAQLTDARFGTYKDGANKGEFFFIAAGIVIVPKMHGDIPVKGLRTQMGPIPMCDTKNRDGKETPFADHYARVLNEIRKLGVETKSLPAEALEDTVKALKEAKPYFRFRTWKGEPTKDFPNPRVNEVWAGIIEDYDPDTTGDAVDDSTPPADDKAPANSHSTPAWEKDAAKEEGGGTKEAISADDLDALAEAADNGDLDAQQKLDGQGRVAGIDVAAAESWADVVNQLKEQDAAAEAPAEEDWAPVKEEVYQFLPPKAKKAIECEVTAVFEGKKTVNLKSLDDGKTAFKAIPWDKLIRE